MKLREYSNADLDAVLSMFHETVHAIRSDDFTAEQLEAWAPDEPDLHEWQERLEKTTTFVAEHNDKVVGFGNVTQLGLIDTLYVHKSAQKTGIGGAILMRLLAAAQRNGIRTVQTETNTLARPFFEKEGFLLIREATRETNGQSFRTFVMTKDMPEEADD